MVHLNQVLQWLAFAATTLGSPTPNHPNYHKSLPLPASLVTALSSTPTWLESIAIRPNGDILTTQYVPVPILQTVRNPTSPNARLEPLHQFAGISAILGITETLPDTYVIVGGNATANATGIPGTYGAWEITFCSEVKVRKIADIPEVQLANGVVALPDMRHVVLFADSQFGLLFRLDTRTGKYEIVADEPEFKPHPERLGNEVGFGINGVKIRREQGALWFYFTSSDLVNVYRVRITKDGYIARNKKIQLYADLNSVATFLDDFTIADDGSLWVTTNKDNTVIAVPKTKDGRAGKPVVAVGEKGSLTVAGATDAEFGRTKKDKDVLYVVTAGGLAAPVNGTVTEAGKVVSVDTSAWRL